MKALTVNTTQHTDAVPLLSVNIPAAQAAVHMKYCVASCAVRCGVL